MLNKFKILEVYIFIHYYTECIYKCIICINSSLTIIGNIKIILRAGKYNLIQFDLKLKHW